VVEEKRMVDVQSGITVIRCVVEEKRANWHTFGRQDTFFNIKNYGSL
jgi:hypothetical protein